MKKMCNERTLINVLSSKLLYWPLKMSIFFRIDSLTHQSSSQAAGTSAQGTRLTAPRAIFSHSSTHWLVSEVFKHHSVLLEKEQRILESAGQPATAVSMCTSTMHFYIALSTTSSRSGLALEGHQGRVVVQSSVVKAWYVFSEVMSSFCQTSKQGHLLVSF